MSSTICTPAILEHDRDSKSTMVALTQYVPSRSPVVTVLIFSIDALPAQLQ
jgi:hypothetical protein